MLKDIGDEKIWSLFLNNKIEKGHINKKELEDLINFINNKEYLNIVENIKDYVFSNPRKIEISKMGKQKKRVVYKFDRCENYILKLIAFMLYKYDNIFSNNLFSYRKNVGVKYAMNKLIHIKHLKNMYGYKVDISNYFNSVNVDKLLPILKDVFYDDYDLYCFFERILVNEYVIYEGKLIKEEKGIMAGVPISAFLANVYLKDMDKYFEDNGIIYFRYADDILMFAKDEESLFHYVNILKNFLEDKKLSINTDKENYYNPGDKWEFLGFSYQNGIIDLSDNTIKKIKGKIRRSSRGIRRWMINKDAEKASALKAMNRKFNRKFYHTTDKSDLNWSKWFFPVINTTKSLKIIDNYMQESLRYIVTGKHNKKNYEKVPYFLLKECNYKSLVHEYYKSLKSTLDKEFVYK